LGYAEDEDAASSEAGRRNHAKVAGCGTRSDERGNGAGVTTIALPVLQIARRPLVAPSPALTRLCDQADDIWEPFPSDIEPIDACAGA
jgi:hypothetical protein